MKQSHLSMDSKSKQISVLLPYPFKGPFDYKIPDGLKNNKIKPGAIVTVPLNRREEIGVIWKKHPLPKGLALEKMPDTPFDKLKPIISILDLPPLPDVLLKFIDWVAAYTLSPPGSVLAMALRSVKSPQPTHNSIGWIKINTIPSDFRITEPRKKVLDLLDTKEPCPARTIIDKTGVGQSVIQGLSKAGIIQAISLPNSTLFFQPDPQFSVPKLSQEQQEASDKLCQDVKDRKFSVTLLQGITGSGKTEVYMEAIARCIEQNQQVLVLLPEIALSTQWTDRFAKRFGVQPALWHSDIGSKRRRLTWQAVAEDNVSVVVGARSALFLPFTNLGLIIIDEEHEASFKQEEGVIYNARDMAIVRAQLSNIPAILVSATPSLETLVNVDNKRYEQVTLSSRHGGATLPIIETLDLRKTPPSRGLFISPPLAKAIQTTLDKEEQAMLFLNRRGYAPLTLCRACGFRLECPNCSAWLVEHRRTHRLVCHHCGYMEAIPKICPHCKVEDSLVPIGPGIERITEEARITFPEARILVMASDTLTSPRMTQEAVQQISDRQVNLIIGTQIVAKGWHFPYLTLVGVVDADLGLDGADLRASERTLQLLHQVGGRAGRAEAAGKVLLQSYMPEHPVMQALVKGDFNAFMHQEAAERQPGFWPPYGRLAAIIVSADTHEDASATAQAIGNCAPHGNGIVVLGPTPAPLALLRNRYRQRLLLRTQRQIAVQPILRQWLSNIKPKKGVKIDIDIDPMSFL